MDLECGSDGGGPQPVAAQDLDQVRERPVRGPGRLGGHEIEPGGGDSLDAAVVGAALDGVRDVAVDEAFEVREELVLLVYIEGEEAVEEGVQWAGGR